jgi:hypothetical protein
MQNTCTLRQADARTRTGDPFITSEVLYQLSYVGGGRQCYRRCGRVGQRDHGAPAPLMAAARARSSGR